MSLQLVLTPTKTWAHRHPPTSTEFGKSQHTTWYTTFRPGYTHQCYDASPAQVHGWFYLPRTSRGLEIVLVQQTFPSKSNGHVSNTHKRNYSQLTKHVLCLCKGLYRIYTIPLRAVERNAICLVNLDDLVHPLEADAWRT